MVRLLEPNAELIPGYKLVRYLGKGGFGEVWEAEAPGGLAKAIKMAPMEHNEAQLNCRELEGLQKMRSIRHPYLLSIERFEVVDGFLVLVMELAEKNLAERFSECIDMGLPGIPRDELLRYMKEASEVLDLMSERHGLQHLDIKPENLFLSSGHVKVADFGLVQPRNTNMNRAAVAVSPPYAPPELFDGRIEPTCDQFSLAVTYQELLTGTRPYQATDVRSLILQHLRGRPEVSAAPPADRTVLVRALQRDPGSRFRSCTEFVQALERASAFGTPTVGVSLPVGPLESAQPTVRLSRMETGPASAPVFVPASRRRNPLDRPKTRTISLDRRTAPLESAQSGGVLMEQEQTRATFVAFLPLEIFAHKLRGFIDELQAEIVSCTDERTVLWFGAKRWFGRRSGRGVFLEIDTYTRNPHSGFRVVDVNIWSQRQDVDVVEMGRRSMMLIRCLKAYMMATDANDKPMMISTAQLRHALTH